MWLIWHHFVSNDRKLCICLYTHACIYPSVKDYKNFEKHETIHGRLLKWVIEAAVFREEGGEKFKQKGKGIIEDWTKIGGMYI